MEIRLKDSFNVLKEVKKEMRHLNIIHMSLKSKKRKRKKTLKISSKSEKLSLKIINDYSIKSNKFVQLLI